MSAVLLLFLGMLSLSLAQVCDTDILINSRMGRTGKDDKNFNGDHMDARLTRECIEAKIPVQKK